MNTPQAPAFTGRALLATACLWFVAALLLAGEPVLSIGLPVSDRVRIWDSADVALVTTQGYLQSAVCNGSGSGCVTVGVPGDNATGATMLSTHANVSVWNGTGWNRANGYLNIANNTAPANAADFPAAGLIGEYNSSPISALTSGRVGHVQLDSTGRLYTVPGVAATWAVTDNSGSLTVDAPIATPVQVSESYDSTGSKTTGNVTITGAAAAVAVPGTALTGRRKARIHNEDTVTTGYLCLNNSACTSAAGANHGIPLPPGSQRDYEIGPTNIVYAYAATTINIVVEELK